MYPFFFQVKKEGKSACEDEEEEKVVLTLLHAPPFALSRHPLLGESVIVQQSLPLSDLYWLGRSA